MNCPNCQTLNPDAARFCFNCGTPLQSARPPDAERKLVTILFADVVGSTALAEDLDPEDVSDIMNGALSLFNVAVADENGMVARLMGDSILAFFGTPVAREDDPERAVRAALSMQQEAKVYAAQLQAQYGIDFKARVGINTGLALLDVVGDDVRAEFTAMGDAVNLASRLEHAAPPDGVLISHDTYRHVRGLFEVEPLEPLQVKGKAEPIQVYLVLGARPRAFRVPTRGVAGVDTPMIGRDAELKQLQDLLDGVRVPGQERAGQVTVVAEAGVGKSRLLSEFINWLTQQPDRVRLFKARASEEMLRAPYSLLRDLFAFEFGIQDSDSDLEARKKLREGILGIVGIEREDYVAFIGHLIGYDFSEDPHLQGVLDDAREIRDRAFQQASQVLKSAMGDGAAVVALEDIHWADEASLDFFDSLLEAFADLPLLLVSIARPVLYERRPSWGEKIQGAARIDLVPLPETDARQLVGEILRRVPDIPPELSELIVSRSEGNPFYVEELVQMLIEDGIILTGDEQWHVHADQLAEARVPPTLTGILQARLDGLPAEERSVLQRASVVGRTFWEDAITRLMEASGSNGDANGIQAGQTLNTLSRRELIYRNDPSAFAYTNEFSFKHAILRDVTYESVLKRLRQLYHAQIARWLGEQTRDQGAGTAARIAEHYELADEIAEAAAWYARAAKQAKDAHAPDAALHAYRKALELDDRLKDPAPSRSAWRIEVTDGLGQVLLWLGAYGESIEAFTEMQTTAAMSGDLLAEANAWHGMAEAQMHEGDFRSSIESAEREEAIALKAGAVLPLAKALWMKAWGAFRLGDVDTALPLATRVAELSSSLDDHGQIAHSLNLLGVLKSVTGRNDEAVQHFEQALEIFRSLGNRRRSMPLLNNLGVIAEGRGDYESARVRYQEALDVAREIGNRDGEMVYLGNLGAVEVHSGDFAAAERDLQAVIRMAGSSGTEVLAFTHAFLAEAQLGLGKPEEALASACQALALAEEMESQEDLGLVWRIIGKLAAARGEPLPVRRRGKASPELLAAEACFAASERIYEQIDRKEERARTLREWGKYAYERGERSQGAAMWEEARRIFEEVGADLEAQRMSELTPSNQAPA